MERKHLRIAIVGSYGNGKTTLARALQRELGLPVVHATPMQMVIGGRTIDLNTCSDNELLQLSLFRHTERLIAETAAGAAFISGGSLMHEWFYAVTRLKFGRFPASANSRAVDNNNVPAATARHLRQVAIQYSVSSYTHLFFVQNEVPLLDSPAPISETFRELLDQSYRLEMTGSGLDFLELTGSPEQRLKEAMHKLSRSIVT